MKKPRKSPPGAFQSAIRETRTSGMNYSAFLSSAFLSSAFLDFLLFFSFFAGASAAGASSALATGQLAGRRTARARKTTRVSFMDFLLDVFGRESSGCVMLQAEVVPWTAPVQERARSLKLGPIFPTGIVHQRGRVALWS